MLVVLIAVVALGFPQAAMAGTVYTSQGSFESALSSRCGLAIIDFEDQSDGTSLTGGEYSAEGFTMAGDLGLEVLSDVVGTTPNGTVGLWVVGDTSFSQEFTVTFSDDRDAIGFYLMDTKDTLEVEGYLLGVLVDTVSFSSTGNNLGAFRGVVFSSEVDEVLFYASDITDGWGVDDIEIVDIDCYTDDDGDGMTEEEGDCDDAAAGVYDGADEYCDSVDNDCDGLTDETDAVDALTWFADMDLDGYGDPGDSTSACSEPAGYVSDDTDCNDLADDAYPGATEYCDGYDNDCDGVSDEPDAVDVIMWFEDSDGDGFGNPASSTAACDQPPGYTSENTDCDDTQNTVYPEADELCDGIDNDCDVEVDEGALNPPTWYADSDGDGYGDADDATVACSQPEGYVDNAADCGVDNPSIHPDADEYCGEVDHDCDGLINEPNSIDSYVVYADTDGDGYGNPDVFQFTCVPVDGFVEEAGDCDDDNSDVCPYCPEWDDGIDNDCDGEIDEPSDRTWEPEGELTYRGGSGCACTSTGYPAGHNLIWVLLSLIALARRRP